MSLKMLQGDCIEKMKELPENSIDSIVTDPPHEFCPTGKQGNSVGIAVNIAVWQDALRILKPGGYLLAFGTTRTYHRLACVIEDAGFEIRDMLQWIYGSDFPIAMDISKAINKQQPTNKPIVLARKPLSEKTVVDNIIRWGTGGINIDDSRIGTEDKLVRPIISRDDNKVFGKGLGVGTQVEPSGRFPANVLLDETAAAILDEQSGILKSGDNCTRRKVGSFLEHGGLGHPGDIQVTYGDEGGASRFFYITKASQKCGICNDPRTVKPINLMEYLVSLITPALGVVLDPFAGSGATGIACAHKGFNFLGIESDAHNWEICVDRLRKCR